MKVEASAKEVAAMASLFCKLFCGHCKPPKPVKEGIAWRLTTGKLAISFSGDWTMLLPDDKTVSATITITDAKGKPAKVDGVPTWDSDNPDAATVVAADDGMSAVVTPGPLTQPEPWTANITVTADADLGAGVKPIIGVGQVTVTGGDASVVEIKFGTPA